jgi:hypothetical protein
MQPINARRTTRQWKAERKSHGTSREISSIAHKTFPSVLVFFGVKRFKPNHGFLSHLSVS